VAVAENRRLVPRSTDGSAGVTVIVERTGAGMTAFEGVDAALSPCAFLATTVKSYEVPFVKPVTVAVVAGAVTVAVFPPGLDVTT